MKEDQFSAIVADMTNHVSAQVHEIVQRAGMTMPTAGSAAAMGACVAGSLSVDIAIFAALSVFDEEWSTEADVLEGFNEVFQTVDAHIAANRDDGWRTVQAKIAERRAA